MQISKLTSVAFLSVAIGVSALGARPAPFADPPKVEKKDLPVTDAPKINTPAARFSGSDSGANTKQVPTTLAKGQRYVIDSAVPLVVAQFAADNGLVKIVDRKGPRPYSAHNTITVHSAEPDNEDVIIVAGPFIYEIQHEADGVVFLEAFPALGKPSADGKPVPLTRDDIVRRVLTLGQGPRPPPEPEPTPTPDPSGPMRVMILFESAATLSADQHTAIYSEDTRNYLNSHCAKLPDGKADYVVWDKDVKGVEKESAIRQDMFNNIKGKSMPWIFAMKGDKKVSQAVPANKAEMLKLLKSVGGP